MGSQSTIAQLTKCSIFIDEPTGELRVGKP